MTYIVHSLIGISINALTVKHKIINIINAVLNTVKVTLGEGKTKIQLYIYGTSENQELEY